MMIPAVVLVLALAAAGLSHPLPNQEQVPAGNIVPQILTEVPVAQFVDKTEVEESPNVYSPIGQLLQANAAVPRVENEPIKLDQTQPNHAENPVLLPLQSLSAAPVREVGPGPRPVIVPAEAISSGRVVIAGVESVQQRSYQKFEVMGNPVPYDQVGDPVTYRPVEAQGVEHIQLKDQETSIQQKDHTQVQYSPEPLIEEEVDPLLQQNVQNSDEHDQKVYSVPDNIQPTEIENFPYQAPVYVPVQTVQQSQVQHAHEKQAPYKEVRGKTEVQNQPAEHQYRVYSSQSVVVGNVETPAPQPQSCECEEQAHNAQEAVQKQGEYQQVNSYAPVENQEAAEQLYDEHTEVEKQGYYQTQSVELQQQQVQVVQQAAESQVPYKQIVQRGEPLEPAYVQQVYNVHPATADQAQPVQTHQVEFVDQQQVYSVQPVVSDQILSQVPHEQLVQQEAPTYIPEQISKSSEAEEPYKKVQQQQVVNYETQTVHNYVEKVSQQHVPVHTLPVVTQSVSVIPTQD